MQVSTISFDRFNVLADNEAQERIRAARARLGERAVLLCHHYQRADVYQHADLTGHDDALSVNLQTSPTAPSMVQVASLGYRWPLPGLRAAVDLFAAYSNVDGGTQAIAAGDLSFAGAGRIAVAQRVHVVRRQFGQVVERADEPVAAHEEAISSKLPAIEASVSAVSAKSEADIKSLRSGIQTALDSVGNEIGTINGKLAKIEEAMKKPAPAAGKGGAAAPTGVRNADGTYTVGKGDTLAGIARKFAVKMDSIEAENPGLDPKKLHAGQKIRIPNK